MQTGSSGTLIGWKSGHTTYVPLWDRMEGAWLWTLGTVGNDKKCKPFFIIYQFLPPSKMFTICLGKTIE